ncbi:MAG: hypothetical protein LBB85_12435 [Dysgonamonadaceae bacterium]|jgi:hypothetical protein|nr:hypothetical protein [Dysgonamonadaceae bacterium]
MKTTKKKEYVCPIVELHRVALELAVAGMYQVSPNTITVEDYVPGASQSENDGDLSIF